MVPTFVKFARSSKAFWLCLPIDFDGASSFLLHLAICGDFSWPFMSILMWPLTNEWTPNNDRFLTFCVVLIGIGLNQSSVLLGVNCSVADLLLAIIVIYLIIRRMLLFPLSPTVFFLVVCVIVLFSATYLVPARFPFNPQPFQICKDFAKLLATFMYFVVGYNLARIGLAERVFRWFSIAGVIIGSFAFSPFVLGDRLGFLYYGSFRFKGLMKDPNYFSVSQICVLVYVFNTQMSRLKRCAALFILTGSILVSGSKTGVITLGVYLCLRFVQLLFRRQIKRSDVRIWLGTGLLIGLLAPFLIKGKDGVLNCISELIPQFERVEMLFTDFGTALSGSGSSRDITWKTAMKLIATSPIIGVGVGTYTGITRVMWGVENIAHNTFLQLAAEWGLPATAFFFTTVLWQLVKATFRAKSSSDLAVICRDIVLIFLVASLAISLNNARLFWLTLGILVWLCKYSNDGISARGALQPKIQTHNRWDE